MIEYKLLHISALDDFDNLLESLKELRPNASHSALVNELRNRVGLNCKTIIIETAYRDYDYSSVYSLFYAKKHRIPARDCLRLFLLSESDVNLNALIGFVVIRDSVTDSRGRAVIKPEYLLESEEAYVLQSPQSYHLLGTAGELSSFPWMAQDTDVDVCAHIAVWSVVNYYAQRKTNYAGQSIGNIVKQTPKHLGRKTPSLGLNLQQMSDILSENGFFPLILQKQEDPTNFYQALYSYIESGIPVIAALTKKGHAIVINGHGKLNYKLLDTKQGIVSPAELIEEWIISDDNYLPFQTIGNNGNYQLSDLDFLLVPLSEKMYLNANTVKERVTALLESGTLDIDKNSIVRIYLTSTRALKRATAVNKEMEPLTKEWLLTLAMPQFIWCADIANYKQYQQGKNSARVIIDSTAGTYENDPWLFMHDSSTVYIRDENGQSYKQNVTIKPYSIYTNNLKHVERI